MAGRDGMSERAEERRKERERKKRKKYIERDRKKESSVTLFSFWLLSFFLILYFLSNSLSSIFLATYLKNGQERERKKAIDEKKDR